MTGFFTNEFHCLTNAVTQSCIREELLVGHGVTKLVQGLITQHDVKLEDLLRITLHQCPQGQFIEYTLDMYLRGGSSVTDTFQGPGLQAKHDTFVLYDATRDGRCEFLHLKH